ncbi:hypothetical protein TanjilG_18221 [Lupinus angustifolius]|uniref:C2H2-type domain-containing protein n=1 Tax=Lupinus angustifolius TaxID=3871 RepID=A0A1J7H590_LUPAN|nr:PREDICTED: zinc finger protein ZAT11-like [Lupinus angustifolius]OIW01650.1 hypothetical protein TanjilG_18221 [Lupinus angustifolius]
MMKRMRENEEKESIALANNLILLTKSLNNSYPSLEFECKTCNRKFSSFQALGGHSASHKKQKLNVDQELMKQETMKPKMHECTICGQEFTMGQALGGHMRRHRSATTNEKGFSSIKHDVVKVPVLKRSNSKRVMCLDLDLNLTPLENDLKLLFGNKAPQVDLSLF